MDAQLAPICVIATPDRHHVAPAIAALERGLHVLLEKPAAHTLQDCNLVLEAARLSPRNPHHRTCAALHPVLQDPQPVDRIWTARSARNHRASRGCRVLAHGPQLCERQLGQGGLIHADDRPEVLPRLRHPGMEPGDRARFWAGNEAPFFGSLLHFRPENAPEGAASRCTAPCPAAAACPFDARRLYLNPDLTGWPVHTITDDLTPGGRTRALREGPYGRCVYRSGSDVVDHQTVTMQTSTGATAALLMNGHASHQERTARYHGTRGSVLATFGADSRIEFTDHLGGATERLPVPTAGGGHGGGDTGLIESFLNSLDTPTPTQTSGETWFESHLLAFAAERARLAGETVDVDRIRSTETSGRLPMTNS